MSLSRRVEEDVIVIDDDTDDDNDQRGGEGQTQRTNFSAGLCDAPNPGKKADSLMTIMHITDHNYAIELLSRFDDDLERTISYLLEGKDRNATSVRRSAARKRPAATGKDTEKPSPKRSLFPRLKKENSCSSEREKALGHDVDKTAQKLPVLASSFAAEGLLCSQWHACYQQAKELSERESGSSFFVDPDFPPVRTSLDGRKASQRPRDKASTTINCHCGLPVTAKVVQRDGPNYGRFYLACGQDRPGMRKRRARVVAEKRSPAKVPLAKDENDGTTAQPMIVNPYAKTSISLKQPSTPSLSLRGSGSSSPQPSPPQRRKCDFFQWDQDGSRGADAVGYSTRYSVLAWQHFGVQQGCVLYRNEIDPSQIRQGAVGNCWFLSALAVVVEKPYLIENILPHRSLNDMGCYQINLCLDGKWTPIIVDSYLPVAVDALDRNRSRKRTPTSHPSVHGALPFDIEAEVEGLHSDTCRKSDQWAHPAFCAAPNLQLWPALTEKAYAKAHGCYAQLTGGFIAEGMQDLTGAPTETILLHGVRSKHARETLWQRLKEFYQEGFIMGVATSGGGDGLVGGHAYSVLSLLQVDDSVLGEQSKMTDFFSKITKEDFPINKPSRKSAISCPNAELVQRKLAGHERSTIRLVHIRNPWGKKEWKGDFSVDSERWTVALRKRLGSNAFAKGDGTFFMSFDDMVERFHHLDVAKTRRGWAHTSSDGVFGGSGGVMSSSEYVYHLRPKEPTPAFITIIQPKKRANTQSKYWYCDPCMLILKKSSNSIHWTCEACVVTGVRRQNTHELVLEPSAQYCCFPFSFLGVRGNAPTFSFRLTSYSAGTVEIIRTKSSSAYSEIAACLLHQDLISRELKIQYPVAERSTLACIHGEGCLVFLALNGASDKFLSIKLSIQIQDGYLLAFGPPDAAHDIAPLSQKILAVVSSDGKLSAATQFHFQYLSSTVTTEALHLVGRRGKLSVEVGRNLELGVLADALAARVSQGSVQQAAKETVETFSWIPQLGASKVVSQSVG